MSAQMVEGKCENCVCWRKSEKGGPVEIGAPALGVCWALPPTPFARLDKMTGRVTAQVNLRCGTRATDSCLAFFVPRPELLQAPANDPNMG